MKNPFKKAQTSESNQNAKNDEVASSTEDLDERGHWGNTAEFILSSMGYAIGLGNLWRFPYLCMRNGGGAFLIPYFVFMMICGMPMFFLELVLGQFSALSPLTVWKVSPLFSGIGWAMLIASAIFLVNYNILFAWVFYYLGMSFRSEVPWKSCDNEWNTPICQSVLDTNDSLVEQRRAAPYNYTFVESSNANRSAAEEFYLFNVLNISTGVDDLGGMQWHLLLALFAAIVLTFLCMCKGIKSSGKVVYVTVTLPYLLLTILLIRGVTLPGSLQGIKYYIIPEWSKLLEFKVWAEACLQVFYSLGPAWGGLITLASYNKFHNNCLRDSIIVCVSCAGTSFYGGFIIFSIIGFMAHDVGQPIEKVIAQGPGLAFVAYPEAISRLPMSPFWAVCFFCMLITLGIDGQFGMLETLISSVIDLYPGKLRKRKTMFIASVSMVLFVLAFPLTTRGGVYIFQLCDWFNGQFSIVTIALFELILVSYCYGIGRFYNDMTLILKKRPSIVWAVMWCGVTPCLLVMMLVVSAVNISTPKYGDYSYPGWAQMVGWFITVSSILPIPLVAAIKLFQARGTFMQRLVHLLTPESDWLPTEKKFRAKYIQANSGLTWRQRFSLRTTLHVPAEHISMETSPEKISLNA